MNTNGFGKSWSGNGSAMVLFPLRKGESLQEFPRVTDYQTNGSDLFFSFRFFWMRLFRNWCAPSSLPRGASKPILLCPERGRRA